MAAGKFRMLAVAVAISVAPAETVGGQPGEPAPPYRFLTADGQEQSFADFRGKVVVINFWATWCVPCRTELPMLDGYHRRHAADGLRVIAVTDEEIAPSRLQKIGASWSFVVARRFHGAYPSDAGLPTNYIIDRAGVIRYAKAGALKRDDLDRLLLPLLGEAEAMKPR